MRPFLVLALLPLSLALALAPGDPVRLPKVTDSYGRVVDLEALARGGKYLVFWFYPKANTPGCSAQAKRYAELHGEFQRLGVEVFGVSADPPEEQCAFVERLAFKGAMIPDRKGELARIFGVGRFFGLYARDTILVNPQGRVEAVWRNVKPLDDPDRVLAHVRQLKR